MKLVEEQNALDFKDVCPVLKNSVSSAKSAESWQLHSFYRVCHKQFHNKLTVSQLLR